jgi:CBS domain-containing protein
MMNRLLSSSRCVTYARQTKNYTTPFRFRRSLNKLIVINKMSSSSASSLSTLVPRQLTRGEIIPEANDVLMWLARFPVERNHPRSTAPNVAPLWKSDEAMVAHTFNTVSEVFGRLISEGFLGCPVIDDRDEFYGMVDMLDLVSHALTSFDAWDLRKSQEMINLQDEGSVWNKFYEISDFRNSIITQVTKVPNWKSKKAYFPVFPGFSLLSVIEQFARLGAHRTPILCPTDAKVTGILTQSMVISLIDQEMFRFGALRDIPVSQITQGLISEIHTVNVNSSAVEAFKKMVRMNVSGFPVINDEGVLEDTISVRDLRGIGPTAGNFDILFNSVGVFKEKCRKLFPSQTPRMPIYVTGADSFSRLILNMRDGNIHRIIVCALNAASRPIPTHVITQRDALRFLLYQLGLMPAAQQLPLSDVVR